MKNTKLAEQLLEIREKVRILEEKQDEQAIRELTALIRESKNLTNQYSIWKVAKAKIEQARERLNEAEELALNYYQNKKASPLIDAKMVFETFLDGLRKIIA